MQVAFAIRFVIAATAASLGAAISSAQCASYGFTSIVAPPCGNEPKSTGGMALSENGFVCGRRGTCAGFVRPMLWQGGSPNFINLPARYSYGRAEAVNSSGQVAGRMQASNGSVYRAFVTINGVAVDMGLPNGMNTAEVAAMNEQGTVVGYTLNTATGPVVAFAWQNGKYELLDLPVGPYSGATSINEHGDIGGWMGESPGHNTFCLPIIVRGQTLDVLSLPPDGAVAPSATVSGLNNRGDACGYYFTFDRKKKTYVRHACAWIDGEVLSLGSLYGHSGSVAHDINDAREIVGASEDNGSGEAAFLWRDGVMHDLNTLVPAGSPVITTPRAINNKGQITGDSIIPGSGVAFLLTPALPETAGDVNCDSIVNVTDLLAVISAWDPIGPVGGRTADLNRDNRIDIFDLIGTILNWG